MFGCIVACIILILCHGLEPNSGWPLWQAAIGFLIVFFLVYWNLSVELNNGHTKKN